MASTKLAVAAGIGFVLGSKAGPGPYQQLESLVRKVAGRPEVRQLAEQVQSATKHQVRAATHTVSAKLRPSNGTDTDETGDLAATDSAVRSYADPQDLQFSKTAAEKEERLDTLLAEGVTPEELDQKEEQLRQQGDLIEPPAGNKPAAQ